MLVCTYNYCMHKDYSGVVLRGFPTTTKTTLSYFEMRCVNKIKVYAVFKVFIRLVCKHLNSKCY